MKDKINVDFETIIDVDKIDESLDDYVKKELSKRKLPNCFGTMVPPLLLRQIKIKESEFFKSKGGLEDEDVIMPAKDIVVGRDVEDSLDLVLTKEGAEFIKNYKQKRAQEYADQLLFCSQCELYEICYRLTTNYLKLLELEKIYKGDLK